MPEALDEELARREKAGELARVKAIYVVSYFDNPMGTTTSLARRRKILDIAKRWSRERMIYVIEDAAYRELRYYGDDVPSLLAFDEDEHGDSRRHVFQVVFAGHPRGLGHLAAAAGASRCWRRRATSISARRISTRC